MSQLNLYCRKIDGKLEFSDKLAYKQWIRNIPEGEDIVVKFNISKSYKSVRQLRLVYLCFRVLSDNLGYTVEEIKGLMKLEQGLSASSIIEGKEVHFIKSLADMTKTELSQFIEKMDIWGFQTLGIKMLSNDDIKFLNDIK